MYEKIKNKKKKQRNKNDILATNILKMAKETFLKFGMWGGLPGGYLCSETGSNQMKDHGAIKV